MANAQSHGLYIDDGGVDVTEQRRLNKVREKGISWKKGEGISASGSGRVRENYRLINGARPALRHRI